MTQWKEMELRKECYVFCSLFKFLVCSHLPRTGTEPIASRQQFLRVILVVKSFGDNLHCNPKVNLRTMNPNFSQSSGTCYSVCTRKHISPETVCQQSPKHKEATSLHQQKGSCGKGGTWVCSQVKEEEEQQEDHASSPSQNYVWQSGRGSP